MALPVPADDRAGDREWSIAGRIEACIMQ